MNYQEAKVKNEPKLEGCLCSAEMELRPANDLSAQWVSAEGYLMESGVTYELRRKGAA